MSETTRRAGLYVLASLGVMLVYTLLYQAGMATLEGQPVTFVEALHVVVETFTTTGYGEQAGTWENDAMLLLTILMQFTGVTLIFLTLPAFVVPLVQEALSSAPPTDSDLTDHVVITDFSPTAATLVDELETREKPYVVVVDDVESAELHEEGYEVVEGDPETVETLEAANVGHADAVVTAADDETNASIILAVRQVAPETRLISLVEERDAADYHRYAGADEVVSPRRLLGQSLASKATASVSTDLAEAVELTDELDIAELLVHRGSPIEGRTIADCGVDSLSGTNIIGAWFRGEFVSPPDPDRVVDEHTILLVAGPPEEVERVKELTLSETRRHRRGTSVVAGYGVVGSTVVESVAGEDLPTTVVDVEEKPGVDIVGDATEPATLREADVDEARSLVLALANDRDAVYAALVAREVAPEVEIIARANQVESVPKLYRAGVEYVLALPTVAGRMLASKLLDEEVITPQMQVELVRTRAPRLVGQTLEQADVRARTNCTVVAVERGDELLTEVGPEFVVRENDVLVIAGNDEAISQFSELAT